MAHGDQTRHKVNWWHILIAAAYQKALHDDTANGLGSGGSRLLDGNSTHAEELERELAAFYNAPAGLLCNSGFDANVGIFSCLPQPGDVIVYDELIHASVHDGMRLSRAERRIPFKHNDVEALRTLLVNMQADYEPARSGRCNVFVAIETVYSMSGDVSPVAEMKDIVQNTLGSGNGHMVVDEAHAVGVMGPKGRGLIAQLGLQDQIGVRLHTFGKALACSGAVILCSPLIREYLINYARPLIYTTFMPFPLLTAIRVSHAYLQQGKAKSLVHHMDHLRETLRSGLCDILASLPTQWSHLLQIPATPSPSAISHIMSPQALDLAAYCRHNGLWVRAILPPTVPAGTERVRICLHGGNTIEEVEKLLMVIRAWADRAQKARL